MNAAAAGVVLATVACAALGCGETGAVARGAREPPRAREIGVEPAAMGSYGLEPAAAPSALEKAAIEATAARLAATGSRVATSAALILASRELAAGAAAGEPEPLAPARVRAALGSAFAFDPAPVVHLSVSSPSSAPLAVSEAASPMPGATHIGVGAAVVEDRAYLVLLVTRRTASLRPFPREIARGSTPVLRGELIGLDGPAVHVTAPSGESRSVAMPRGDGRHFSAPIEFDTAGRWRIEVLGNSARGPEVAALFSVACGGGWAGEPTAATDPADPEDDRDAEARVVSALNTTRKQQRLPPLEAIPALADVARRHSEAMLAAGVLAHRLPGSDGPGERLRRARVPFAVVLENVAKGPGALAAHRLIEESPAHRQNMLSPEATRVGCGIARGTLPSGERIVYLTELFVRPVDDGRQGDGVTPERRVREALSRERTRAGAPPLAADPALDALARSAARDMLRSGDPGPTGLAERALDGGRKLAAADGFVASKPADAARSRNLADPRFRRVGVGVAIGDSERFGAGLLWIAVVYTD